MDRNQKRTFVADLNQTLQGSSVVVAAHYRGLTVADMTALRTQLRAVGGELKVTKNRLAKLAFQGTPYTNIADMMKGPSALATSADPVAAAKAAHEFAAKNDKFVILGGALGEKVLSAAEVKALASLPSLNELRAQLIGLLQAPATKLATVTQEPAAQLARVTLERSKAIA